MTKQRPAGPAATEGVADDVKIFRAAVRDVVPLAQTAPAAGLAGPKRHPRRRKAAASALENLQETMPLIGAVPDDELLGAEDRVSADGALSFQRAGVRDQAMRRLRRGLYPLEDELDLHGFNQTEARRQLAEFLVRSRDGGRRCVRVVHGKGYRSGARGPILKAAVNLWLRRHVDVMAFVSARAIDGGAGAVYVLLRA